ncbi:hypothetical protein J6590_028237 [Homalodisca vitripennis]|nr:hypothetical protein J6590_028237 [Homalodisca vitripennis]
MVDVTDSVAKYIESDQLTGLVSNYVLNRKLSLGVCQTRERVLLTNGSRLDAACVSVAFLTDNIGDE